jgi:hypothetical protein
VFPCKPQAVTDAFLAGSEAIPSSPSAVGD